jgi:putative tryptophan/tyrosine transport system substrate-binding protein
MFSQRLGAGIQRREFIGLMGVAAGWPLAARAQQPAVPVIGFVSSLSAKDAARVIAAFQAGLKETGYDEGRNVRIEYRWAEGHYDRLPTLVAELVNRQVVAIAAISGTPTALAAKAATKTIPVVFAIGSDPVVQGLVDSLARPGANVTGATFSTAVLGEKRLEFLRELAPNAKTIAVLVNAANPSGSLEIARVTEAANAVRQQISVLNASTVAEIDGAFAVIAEKGIQGLFVTADPFFLNQRQKLVELSARHRLPTIYPEAETAAAGGLVSYGASRTDAYRLAGNYVGRILKGEKPGELPVQQATRFEVVINLKTAKALGLTIPQSILLRADEVIE